MICRREANGWSLITQPAHAWLAGELAAVWGNEPFARPEPYEALVMGTRLHDIGWLTWDDSPRLGEDGRPVNFLDTTLDDSAPIWPAAVGVVSLIDPFAALLVSMHGQMLYRARMERGIDPLEDRARLKALIDEQSALQDGLRGKMVDHPIYGPALAEEKTAYRWLRVCDIMSLLLCSDAFGTQGEIPEVPLELGGNFAAIRYRKPEPFTLLLEPWPFKQPVIRRVIQRRFIDRATFGSQAAFLEELGAVPWLDQAITISSA